MSRAVIVGVMGGGEVSPESERSACRLGALIAARGWVLLNGGRNAGIMAASARGARKAGGTTVGILPDETDHQVSPDIEIPILTGMGSARNCINVLSSRVVVACRGGSGTISEIALALKYGRPVVLLDFHLDGLFAEYRRKGRLVEADTPEKAVELVESFL